MTQKRSLNDLCKGNRFSRSELLKYFEDNGFDMSKASFNNRLTELIKNGEIVRIGHNTYVLGNYECAIYSYIYSAKAQNIAKEISDRYPFVDFRIFETCQLNEFINHLLAHNTTIVYVEPVALESVFEELKTLYPGKVLLNPSIDMYHQYWSDDMIVLKKLVTESPKGLDLSWHTRLEKMIVDLVADKLLSKMIQDNEIDTVIEEASNKYTIDISCLGRYARRRKALGKIEKYTSADNMKRMGLIND